MSKKMVNDSSTAIRRETALSMRYIPATQAQGVLVAMIKQWDGKDRHYLEAFGYGSDNKTTEIYQAVKKALSWDKKMTMIAWRLHPTIAVADLQKIAMNDKGNILERYRAIDGIAFNNSIVAYKTMKEISEKTSAKLKERSSYWVKYNSQSRWSKYTGKQNFTYVDSLIPVMKASPVKIADVLKLTGNAAKGKVKAAACQMCHQINGAGVDQEEFFI
jgi:hypothetical protein